MKFLSILFLPLLLWAQSGKLLHVIDGDTLLFLVDNKKVLCQLAYVDAPESHTSEFLTKQSKQCAVPEEKIMSAGKIAKEYLASLVKEGNSYTINIVEDNEGIWATCVVPIPKGVHISINPTLNQLLLEQGYGVTYKRYEKEILPIKLREDASLAQKEKRGLWKRFDDVMECLKKR